MRHSLIGIALTALAACTTSAERSSTAALGDSGIENRRWLLFELNGQPVPTGGTREPAYLELDSEQSRVAGNAPCNRFSGTYELAGNRLQFPPNIVSTRRACPELDLEGEFLAMLVRVDTYALANGVLELKSTGAPVARFRAAD